MQDQNILFECPFCCVTLKNSIPASYNSEEVSEYSDGYIEFENRIPFSKVVQCPACNEVFFYENLETQPICNPNEICIDIMEPSVDRIIELLKNASHTPEQVLYLREEIWYFGTHHPDGYNEILNNPNFKNQWLDNLEILEQILNESDNDQLLLKAEANRQLGRFSRCLELLENYKGEKDIKYIKTIRKKVSKGNTEVFEI